MSERTRIIKRRKVYEPHQTADGTRNVKKSTMNAQLKEMGEINANDEECYVHVCNRKAPS